MKNENDISAEKASESKGSRFQSENVYKVGTQGLGGKTRKGQKDPYYIGKVIMKDRELSC